jgi:3'(2'), 5'-bisphosphate nucleotidase
MSAPLARELAVASEAAEEASAIIARFYARGLAERTVKDDATPVTAADLAADAAITRRLRAAFPADGIVSEESPATAGERLWIVDPLDGTQEFLDRTGDFVVLIGLAVDGIPVLGVLRTLAATYHAVRGGGAWRGGARLRVSGETEVARFRAAVGRFGPRPAPFGRQAAGIGAGIKYVRVAEGELEVALWLTPREKLWDTCAPEVLVREAGGLVTDVDGAPLRYDRAGHVRGVVASNGTRHAQVAAECRRWFEP